MSGLLQPEAELVKRLRVPTAELREIRSSHLGEDALAWLALVPVWRDDIAREIGYPSGPEGIAGFVARAVAAGLCETETIVGPDASSHLCFWMPDFNRDEVLAQLEESLRIGYLRRTTGEIAARLPADASAAGELPALGR